MNSNNSYGAHSAEPTRSSRSPKSSGSGNAFKFVLLGLVLVLIVLVLVLLIARGSRSSGEITNAAASANLTSTVLAQDYTGKDIGSSLTVTAGTLAPPDVNPADAILMDISWTGKKAAEYPIILTVSDPSFVDGNGLIVFHYTNNQWVKVGTYTIADHSVTFLADSLSPFAFIDYNKYNTPTPEASGTPAPSMSPSPTPSTSPSPSPSVSPSPTSGGGGESPYDYDPAEQTVKPGPSMPTEAPVIVDPTDPPEPTDDPGPGPESGGDIEETDES